MSSISAGTTTSTALVSTGDTTGALVLKTNGSTTAVTIDTSQNVGIGTSSPTEKMTVAGAIISTGAASSSARDAAIIDYSSATSRFIASRAGGNYGGWEAHVAGASGVTKRHQIAYDSTFYWYGADGTTERMRLTSDGYLRMASGSGGIQFNGDTAAANALDDYEEGTWTPASGGGTANTGKYTKIGRVVHIYGDCTFTGVGSVSPTISGLPFNPDGQGAFCIGWTDIGQQLSAVFVNGSALNVYNQQDSLVNIPNNGRIIFSACYVTA